MSNIASVICLFGDSYKTHEHVIGQDFSLPVTQKEQCVDGMMDTI
jgi:hypothetical protein